jgi:hypothetical protein
MFVEIAPLLFLWFGVEIEEVFSFCADRLLPLLGYDVVITPCAAEFCLHIVWRPQATDVFIPYY